jgi:hypothetical protein
MSVMGPGLALCQVHFGLQAVALGQQGDVLGCQVGHNRVKTGPEGVGRHARSGQHFLFNELVQDGGNLQAFDLGAGSGGCGHEGEPFQWSKRRGMKNAAPLCAGAPNC